MSVFAGFWVDGAVRKPEARHADKEGCIIGRWKCFHEPDFDLLLRRFDRWHEVYWLDITPRESLTPEELYSLLRVVWPKLQQVDIEDDDCWSLRGGYATHTPIIWGNLTQYPPPAEPQWIVITKDNLKDYLFQECRFRNSTMHEWRVGIVCGWDSHDCCCLVDSDYVEEMAVMSWRYVEVQA